ncbi:MAG: hypothetical protein JWQ96_3066, partial [Segetibacter sp.]|nr:hypothetical protein [Segetibacter sp.]
CLVRKIVPVLLNLNASFPAIAEEKNSSRSKMVYA